MSRLEELFEEKSKEALKFLTDKHDMVYSVDVHSDEFKKQMIAHGLKYDEVSGLYFTVSGRLVRPSIVEVILRS